MAQFIFQLSSIHGHRERKTVTAGSARVKSAKMSGFDFSMNRSQLLNGTLPKEAGDRLSEFTVKFWGVRGDIPTPGLETLRYGGNTACVEIEVGGKCLIFDGGTGLRALGKHLVQEAAFCEIPRHELISQEPSPIQAHLFFTHTHWDRIQGFPFFAPAFLEGNHFDIYGAVGANGASIKQRLYDQMLRPHFPLPIQTMRSHLQFHDIAPGAVIQLDDVAIDTIALNRSNGAMGYRITWNGHSVVYATDIETSPNQIDNGLLYLASQADLLIYDTAPHHRPRSDKESFEQKPVWCMGVEAAIAAQVKQLALFHHDPDCSDDFLDRVEAEAQGLFPNLRFAREGVVIPMPASTGSSLKV